VGYLLAGQIGPAENKAFSKQASTSVNAAATLRIGASRSWLAISDLGVRILYTLVGGIRMLRQRTLQRDRCPPQPHKLWILASIIILGILSNSAISMIVQLYLKELRVAPLVISANTAIIFLGIMIGSSFWGRLADLLPLKGILTPLLASAGAVTSGLILLPPHWITLALVFLQSMIISGLVPLGMSVVSKTAFSRRGRNLGYVAASRSLGWMLGQLFGGILLESMDFRWAFATLTLSPLAAILVVPFVHSDISSRDPSQWVESKQKTSLKIVYLASTLRQMGTAGCLSLIFVYMSFIGIPTAAMGIVSALNSGTQVLGMPLFGRLADRVGRRRVFLLGYGIASVVPLLFIVAHNAPGMGAGFFLLGIAFSALYVGSAAYIGDHIHFQRHGTAESLDRWLLARLHLQSATQECLRSWQA